MSQIKIVFVLILVLTVLLSLIPYLLPVPSHVEVPMQFRFDIAVLIFLALERVGAGVIFPLGLKNFKTEFKHVYYLICAGVVMNGVFSLFYPLSRYINAWESWFGFFTADLPTMLSFVIIYIGIHKFAGLMGIRNFYTSYLQYLPILFASLAILWFLPHPQHHPGTELEFYSIHSTLVTEMFFSFLSAGLVLEIRKVASNTYSRALWWFALALLLDGFACLYYIGYDFLLTPAGLPEETIAILFIVCGFIFLIAGYSFNTMTTAAPAKSEKAYSTVDIIVYMAGLASKFRDIDPYLEPMRFITAKLEKDQIPSAEQEKELVQIYKNIENYLTTKEPLRNYTQESLRQEILSRFNRIPS